MRLKKLCLREWTAFVLGSVFYALFYTLGSQIDRSGATVFFTSLARFSLTLPVAAVVLYALFAFVLPRLELAPDRAEKKPFCTLGAFGLILLSFVPLFLIEYPGSFMYDISAQVTQIATGDYSMFHPLAHTLLIRACLSLRNVLGSIEKCAVVYSVISMTVMAVCFSLVASSISRSVSRRAAGMCTGFFCLYPAHMAMASNCTKDGLFAAFLALFLVLCAEKATCGEISRRHCAIQIVAGILACLLRNNMVYAMAAWAVLLLLNRKKYLSVAICALIAIVLSRGINTGLGAYTNADKGSVGEMLSVPIQQLARARLIADEVFTDEERELMDTACEDRRYGGKQVWRNYEPTLSDPVKNYLDMEFVNANMSELAALWVRIGKERPDLYLDAFLALALPSFYPYSEYRVAQPYMEIGIQPGAMTAPFGLEPIIQPGRFAAIRKWLYEHVYKTGMDDVPMIRYVFNTGFVYWLLMLFALYDMYSGRWERISWKLLPVLLWGTYLLGPVMQGRYLYPFICILPLFVLRPKKIEG